MVTVLFQFSTFTLLTLISATTPSAKSQNGIFEDQRQDRGRSTQSDQQLGGVFADDDGDDDNAGHDIHHDHDGLNDAFDRLAFSGRFGVVDIVESVHERPDQQGAHDDQIDAQYELQGVDDGRGVSGENQAGGSQ